MSSSSDFPLDIHPSWWNVLKFVILSLIITPLLEFLFQRMLSTLVTYHAICGRPIPLFDTNLGIFSLHSGYWGRHRNITVLLAPGLVLLATDVLFEFSFSTASVDVPRQMVLWSQPSHRQRYLATDDVIIQREPTAFPDQAAQECLEGPSIMLRRNGSALLGPTFAHILGPFEYILDGKYQIRQPFLDQQNYTVWCSLDYTVANATILVPGVYGKTDFETEGYDLSRDHGLENMEQWKQIVLEADMVSKGELRFDGFQAKFFVGAKSVCVHGDNHMRHSLCMLRNNSDVALVRSRVLNSNDFSTILGVVMHFSGPAVRRLSEPGRQIRFLAYILEKRALSSDLSRGHAAATVRKHVLEQIAKAALVIANEKGVGGIREFRMKLPVRFDSRQIAVAKDFVTIPLALLCLLFVAILLIDVSFRIRIERKDKKFGGTWRWSSLLRREHIEFSKQWLREKLANDLVLYNMHQDVQSSDIGPWVELGERSHEWHVLPHPCSHVRPKARISSDRSGV